LHTRKASSSATTLFIVLLIVIVTGALTFYHYLSFDCIIREYCNGTQLFLRCFDVTSERFVWLDRLQMCISFNSSWYGNMTNPHSDQLRSYIKWSTYINAIFVVILPIALLTLLNAMLIAVLRRRDSQMMRSEDAIALKKMSSHHLAHQKTEIKVCNVHVIHS
jgi:hypothetical protein